MYWLNMIKLYYIDIVENWRVKKSTRNTFGGEFGSLEKQRETRKDPFQMTLYIYMSLEVQEQFKKS